MLQKNSYLILAVGTDIGKTFLVEKLCRKYDSVAAIKPIASGCQDDDKNSDPAKILAALGKDLSKKNLNEIAPWRFTKPVSPHFAGKINFLEVVKFCRKKIAAAKKEQLILFIEAAGGVMTPITEEKTFLDLAIALKIPVILLSANYLGAISHTLTAVAALKAKKIVLKKIILNENFSSRTKTKDLISTLQNFSGIETLTLKQFLKSKNV